MRWNFDFVKCTSFIVLIKKKQYCIFNSTHETLRKRQVTLHHHKEAVLIIYTQEYACCSYTNVYNAQCYASLKNSDSNGKIPSPSFKKSFRYVPSWIHLSLTPLRLCSQQCRHLCFFCPHVQQTFNHFLDGSLPFLHCAPWALTSW